MKKENKEFCEECRKVNTFHYKLIEDIYNIGGKQYKFFATRAICDKCNSEIGIPKLININNIEVSKQYRENEDLIQNDEIEKLMKIYNIGKAPLSLALGFGEITITRYLSGMIPSKEYSDRIKKALSNPKYMMECLNKNREKIGDTAYNKSKKEVDKLRTLFNSMSREMTLTVSMILGKLEDVSPLALEKLLYYIQNIYLLKYKKPLFNEDCSAWAHGPVFKNVYEAFKTFKYNPIEDERFSILKYYDNDLDSNAKDVINLVINTFGVYSGKTLERITHNETPWKETYNESALFLDIDQTMSIELMNKYFKEMNSKYDLLSEKGINDYIKHMLKK